MRCFFPPRKQSELFFSQKMFLSHSVRVGCMKWKSTKIWEKIFFSRCFFNLEKISEFLSDEKSEFLFLEMFSSYQIFFPLSTNYSHEKKIYEKNLIFLFSRKCILCYNFLGGNFLNIFLIFFQMFFLISDFSPLRSSTLYKKENLWKHIRNFEISLGIFHVFFFFFSFLLNFFILFKDVLILKHFFLLEFFFLEFCSLLKNNLETNFPGIFFFSWKLFFHENRKTSYPEIVF